MSCFKRERDQAQRVDPSNSEGTRRFDWLRFLGKKHRRASSRGLVQETRPGDGPANTALNSRPPSSHQEPPARRASSRDLVQETRPGDGPANTALNSRPPSSHQEPPARRASSRDLVQETRPGDGPANTALNSRPPSTHQEPPALQSLWDRAYDALQQANGKLVEEYETLLLKDSTSDDELPPRALPPDDLTHGVDRRSRRAQLESIITQGLQRVENHKKKYTIAGHEFSLTDQIAQAADLMLKAKELIGEAVKQSPEASIAWAGVSIILPLLTNPKIAGEANRDGFTYVTTRMSYYAELETPIQQLDKDPKVAHALVAEVKNQIVTLYQHILEFQIRSVLRFFGSSFKTYFGDVFSADKWKQMRDGIEKQEKIINKSLDQINGFTLTQEIQSLDEATKENLEAMRQVLSVAEEQLHVEKEHLGIARRTLEIQEDEVKQKLSDKQVNCLQLFRLTSSGKDVTYEGYKDRVENRVDGTCEWFLNHEDFQSWLKQDSGLLLVTADPGCGKSVLAKYLIDHKLSSPTICYFFFKDNDQNTVRQALCALLHQLFLQRPFLIKHATKQFDQDGPGLINSTRSLWTVLGNAVQDSEAGPIIVVLDALDECAESEFEGLVENLKNQFCSDGSSHGKLKCLLTTRSYEQIVSKFQYLFNKFPYKRVSGEDESEIISQEVNQVIKYRVDRLAKEKGLKDDIRDHLETNLLEIPHRTYLWVYLIFDFLETEQFKMTQKGVDSTMATMPKNVYEAYEQILRKSKNDVMTRKALSIILAARRPLTVTEMNVALNTNATLKSIDDLDLEEEKDFERTLRSWCGLFVSINQGKVYFLHQTAREFLLNSSSTATIAPGALWQHSITRRDAHMVLAELCVTYLDFLNSDSIPTDESWETDHLHNYTFLNYAARYWGDHFRQACVSDNASILQATLRICDPGLKSYSKWFKIYWHLQKRDDLPHPTSLLISSYFGHEVVVKLLLGKGVDVKSEDGASSMFWAATNGNLAVVKLLLEAGANVDAKDKVEGETPLSGAARKGHEAIVKLLLDAGADRECEDEIGWTPLMVAAANEHETVVKMLSEAGANIESEDNSGRTPLLHALSFGNGTAVKALLEAGANIESKDKYGSTALCHAIGTGNEAIVKLLLEKGADVNSKAVSGQTPLFWAPPHEKIFKLLLEAGANVESKDKDGGTVFMDAVSTGNEAIVKLLLEKGADINSKTVSGKTPLFRATAHEKIVKLLLEAGANVESKDKDGGTAFMNAVATGNEAVVKLLLEKGADINSKTAYGMTPLIRASAWGHEEIVKLLLEVGANIESKTDDGWTALLYAVNTGNEALVKLLLEKGADVNSQVFYGKTPFLFASEKGHEETVKLLLAAGANIESKDENGWTALMWAVDKGKGAVVKLLLEKGADINTKSVSGETPLSLASKRGHEEIIKLFQSAK